MNSMFETSVCKKQKYPDGVLLPLKSVTLLYDAMGAEQRFKSKKKIQRKSRQTSVFNVSADNEFLVTKLFLSAPTYSLLLMRLMSKNRSHDHKTWRMQYVRKCI